MNDIHKPLLLRLAAHRLDELLRTMPVVVVMGSRQTGKSTLVRTHGALEGHEYWSLDDLRVRGDAERDPWTLIRRSPKMILDEVQRVPDLLLAVKQVVDDGPRVPGQFVLTGSANLLIMKQVSESLAGRAGYLTLRPFTVGELGGTASCGPWSALLDHPPDQWRELLTGTQDPSRDWRTLARAGGYPTPSYELDDADTRSVWFDGYVDTYLERDLRQLSAVSSLPDFQRFMQALAVRAGGVINLTKVAQDLSVSRPTAHRWLNLLETSYLVSRVAAYSVNRTKRLVKSPKVYWSDTGLGLHLSGLDEPSGAHLESLVLGDLLAWADGASGRPSVLYWRTQGGAEVDFVIERKRRLLAIEIKTTERPSLEDARHLVTFRNEYPELFHGALLLHGGDRVFSLGDGIVAAPWWSALYVS